MFELLQETLHSVMSSIIQADDTKRMYDFDSVHLTENQDILQKANWLGIYKG